MRHDDDAVGADGGGRRFLLELLYDRRVLFQVDVKEVLDHPVDEIGAGAKAGFVDVAVLGDSCQCTE